MKKHALQFTTWLMENCELAKDNSLWSYNGEDYSLEGIYKVFNQSNKLRTWQRKNEGKRYNKNSKRFN